MSRIDILAPPQDRFLCADLSPGWRVVAEHEGDDFWCAYEPEERVDRPDTGYKIHVSASVGSAREVLAKTAPVLFRLRVPFKHAASAPHLAFLSSGAAGRSQIGKFLTAYPADIDAGRELAALLHDATQGLAGPRIPLESPLCPGSLVHFRYGGFTRRWIQLATGRIVPARSGREGLEPDLREVADSAASNAVAAFAAPDSCADNSGQRLLRDRYMRVQQLHASPKGSTWLGFDQAVSGDSLIVIKEAFAYVMEATDGMDARQRLQREADRLRQLASTGFTPVFQDYWEADASGFLVYRHLAGPPFAAIINALSAEGLHPTRQLLLTWMAALSAAVDKVHRAGVIIGDIKPHNLIFTGDAFQFIDLELAGPPTDEPTGSMGTRGYCSPQQSDPQSGRSFLDDVYAIGATMLAAATLTDAAALPDVRAVARLERRRAPANSALSIIEQCLAREPGERPASAAEIHARCQVALAARPPRRRARRAEPLDIDFLQPSCEIGDAIVQAACRQDGWAWWISHHPTVGGNPGRDLYAGSAGTALFLCALYGSTGVARYLEAAAECGRWLWDREPEIPRQVEMPGLYFGDAGCGVLYLALHLATGEPGWLDRAHEVGKAVARMAGHSPDLMTGAAGTGLFHLALWRAGGGEEALGWAKGEADALMRRRNMARPTWTIPPNHEGLSGADYMGFSHGSAGVGYFLAEYCLLKPEPDLVGACVDIADWLVAQGRPALHDGRGMTWSTLPDGEGTRPSYWCHGATGIAKFLVKAHELSGRAAHLEAAEAAGRLLAAGGSWGGTTQCHGLAGNIEVLLELSARTGDRYLGAAQRLGQNLLAYRTPQGWPSDAERVFSHDLMIGQAGVGAAFLRLSNPQNPHLLSCEAFRAPGLFHFPGPSRGEP